MSANLSLGAPRHQVTLSLKTSLKTTGVSWLTVDDMFALELVTYRRCFPAQPVLPALQNYNWRKWAHLLRDLAATADLLPHSALFSQQLLDITHKWWTEREDNDTHIFDVLPLAAVVHIHNKLHPYPDPQQPARPLADLLTAIAALLARRQLHNAPLLHSAWTMQEVATEECRILGSVNHELGTYTPAVWIQIFKQRVSLWCQQQSPQSPRSLLSRSLPTCLLVVLKILLTCTFQSSHSLCQSCWGICVVPLVRVLDLSPTNQNVLEVTQRRTVDFCSFTKCLSGFNSRLKCC